MYPNFELYIIYYIIRTFFLNRVPSKIEGKQTSSLNKKSSNIFRLSGRPWATLSRVSASMAVIYVQAVLETQDLH